MPRKKNSVVFANQILSQPRKPSLPLKPSKQWIVCPENRFYFSREFSLPVLKTGAPDLATSLDFSWEWGTGSANASTIPHGPAFHALAQKVEGLLDKTGPLPSEPSTTSTDLPHQDSVMQDSLYTQSVQSTAYSGLGDSPQVSVEFPSGANF
jgi:hypothetical protein